MAFRLKKGKERTCISGVILGDCTEEDLKKIFISGDTRFIEEIKDPPKKKKTSEKDKDKESKDNEQ